MARVDACRAAWERVSAITMEFPREWVNLALERANYPEQEDDEAEEKGRLDALVGTELPVASYGVLAAIGQMHGCSNTGRSVFDSLDSISKRLSSLPSMVDLPRMTDAVTPSWQDMNLAGLSQDEFQAVTNIHRAAAAKLLEALRNTCTVVASAIRSKVAVRPFMSYACQDQNASHDRDMVPLLSVEALKAGMSISKASDFMAAISVLGSSCMPDKGEPDVVRWFGSHSSNKVVLGYDAHTGLVVSVPGTARNEAHVLTSPSGIGSP